MTQFSFCLTIAISLLSFTQTVNAQLKNGEVIKIKNVHSGKYAEPAGKTIITNQPANPGTSTIITNQPRNRKDKQIKVNQSKPVSTNPQILNQTSPAQNTSNKNRIEIISANENAEQKWKAILVNGYYRFQNTGSKKYLCVINRSMEQGGTIGEISLNNSSELLWKLEQTSTGYKLRNKRSNLFASVEGGSTNEKNKVIQWEDNGQPDIIWQFETVGSGHSDAGGKKVLFDIVLNYLAVSEATRNRIDNGDCKRIFGQVSTELWELDNNNEMKTRLRSYNNMPELIYNQTNYKNPTTAALSFYQDNPDAYNNNHMGKVTYNIPEILIKEKKVMLVVKTILGTRHKDNDLASYDALRMVEESQNTYILDSYNGNLSETIQTITDNGSVSDRSILDMTLLGLIIPSAIFTGSDDTHKIWVKFSTKIN